MRIKKESVEVKLEREEDWEIVKPVKKEEKEENLDAVTIKDDVDDEKAPLRVLIPTDPSVWGSMNRIASGVNRQGNHYCKHYLASNPEANTYHYLNRSDGSVYYKNPDESEYFYDPETRFSMYTFPPDEGHSELPRMKVVNKNADFYEEQQIYFFSCPYLHPSDSQ